MAGPATHRCTRWARSSGTAARAQKQKYLPKIASGELRLQAFGVTEPTSGTDTTRIRTFAKRDGDKYIVNGQKIWISRVEHSDLMVLLVRTAPREDSAKPTDGMSVLLVDLREAVGKAASPSVRSAP
jgi:acyl-CoA dehydrogenase